MQIGIFAWKNVGTPAILSRTLGGGGQWLNRGSPLCPCLRLVTTYSIFNCFI
jgi:hypothetical protein